MRYVALLVVLSLLAPPATFAGPLPPLESVYVDFGKALNPEAWVNFRARFHSLLWAFKKASQGLSQEEEDCLEANLLLKALIDACTPEDLVKKHTKALGKALDRRNDACRPHVVKSLQPKLNEVDSDAKLELRALKVLVAGGVIGIAGWVAWVAANAGVLVPVVVGL